MDEKEARKILEEYTANITHCGEESFAISTILNRLDELENNALTLRELTDIVLNTNPFKEEFKPDIECFKGYILGTCAKSIEGKRMSLYNMIIEKMDEKE